MLLTRTILFPFLALACSIVAEAKSYMRSTPKDVDLKALQVKQKSADKAHISPKLDPESSDKFFKKDYPFDKRPVADPFHFKHPYPVVQDSGDYDRDFVKDENSDNGNWKAQETYDRLRTKLRREKKQLAEALATRGAGEKVLKDAMRRHAKEAKEREDAAKKVDRLKHDEEERHRHEEHEEEEEQKADHTHSVPGKAHKKPNKHSVHDSAVDSKDVDGSTEETEKAMKQLEDCKKELAEARGKLKELMKELEEAKAAQTKANAALDETMKKELSEKEHHATLKKEVNSQYKEYTEAKAAYEKQNVNVDKLEAQIKIAAAKVKAIRDSEDADGGITYKPDERPQQKSGTPAAGWLWALPLAIATAWVASA